MPAVTTAPKIPNDKINLTGMVLDQRGKMFLIGRLRRVGYE